MRSHDGSMALEAWDGASMKPGEWIPFAFGSVSAFATLVGVWFTGKKIGDDHRKDRELAARQAHLEGVEANNTAAANYSKLAADLMNERQEREAAFKRLREESDAREAVLQGKIDDLKAMVSKLQAQQQDSEAHANALLAQNAILQEQIVYKDRRIEQLQGELRQTKQITDSTARVMAETTEAEK